MNDDFKVTIITLTIWSILSILIIVFLKVPHKYDVNNDGKVNSQDLFEVKNYIMEKGEERGLK
jgi:hypothetical protein